jgi:hypothetical protein
MDIDTNDPFQKNKAYSGGGISYLQRRSLSVTGACSTLGTRTPIMTRDPGGRYHKKRRQENAHDVVAFRRGLVRAERPGESEDAACAD